MDLEAYHGRLTKIIGLVEKAVKWPLLSGSLLERWASGKLVILGDAAHSMVPYMSQGTAVPRSPYIMPVA